MAYSTTLATLVDRTRRFVRDYPSYDLTTAAMTDTTGTSVTVADTSIYAKRWPIDIDYETMMITAIPNGTTLTVIRGVFGSTATTHASGAKVLVRPSFYGVEIQDALNQAILGTFPWLYLAATDVSLTTLDSTYEYTVPSLPSTYNGLSIQMPRVRKVELKYTGDLAYREVRRWQLVQGGNGGRLIRFRSSEPAGAGIRVSGWGPFPALTSTATALHSSFPPEAEYILPMYATALLLMSGEAGRDRMDTGAVDSRESANQVGASLRAGTSLLQQARSELLKVAMPPLPPHTKANV